MLSTILTIIGIAALLVLVVYARAHHLTAKDMLAKVEALVGHAQATSAATTTAAGAATKVAGAVTSMAASTQVLASPRPAPAPSPAPVPAPAPAAAPAADPVQAMLVQLTNIIAAQQKQIDQIKAAPAPAPAPAAAAPVAPAPAPAASPSAAPSAPDAPGQTKKLPDGVVSLDTESGFVMFTGEGFNAADWPRGPYLWIGALPCLTPGSVAYARTVWNCNSAKLEEQMGALVTVGKEVRQSTDAATGLPTFSMTAANMEPTVQVIPAEHDTYAKVVEYANVCAERAARVKALQRSGAGGSFSPQQPKPAAT